MVYYLQEDRNIIILYVFLYEKKIMKSLPFKRGTDYIENADYLFRKIIEKN